MPRKTKKTLTKKEIKECLQCVVNSCAEGYTGEWDSVEGKDGFIAMADCLMDVAKYLKIKIQYPEFKDEEEEIANAIDYILDEELDP